MNIEEMALFSCVFDRFFDVFIYFLLFSCLRAFV